LSILAYKRARFGTERASTGGIFMKACVVSGD